MKEKTPLLTPGMIRAEAGQLASLRSDHPHPAAHSRFVSELDIQLLDILLAAP